MEENTTINRTGTEPDAGAPEALDREEIARLVEQIVAQRLEQLQRAAEGRVAEARAEGERLANMSDDERRRYEAAREREAQLSRREAELARRELRAQAVDELIARGLPRELEQLLDCADEQSCAASIDTLEKVFREAVQRGVDERIGKGRALPRSNGDAQPNLVRRMRAAAGLDREG